MCVSIIRKKERKNSIVYSVRVVDSVFYLFFYYITILYLGSSLSQYKNLYLGRI